MAIPFDLMLKLAHMPLKYPVGLWKDLTNFCNSIFIGAVNQVKDQNTLSTVKRKLNFIQGSYLKNQYLLHLTSIFRKSAELHLVHMNERYNSIEEALKNHDGLAVFGILLSSDAVADKPWFQGISSAAELGLESGGNQTVGQFNLKDIANELDYMDLKYYTYEGSLTTPPCSEVVTWMVAKEILPVSPNQVISQTCSGT